MSTCQIHLFEGAVMCDRMFSQTLSGGNSREPASYHHKACQSPVECGLANQSEQAGCRPEAAALFLLSGLGGHEVQKTDSGGVQHLLRAEPAVQQHLPQAQGAPEASL